MVLHGSVAWLLTHHCPQKVVELATAEEGWSLDWDSTLTPMRATNVVIDKTAVVSVVVTKEAVMSMAVMREVVTSVVVMREVVMSVVVMKLAVMKLVVPEMVVSTAVMKVLVVSVRRRLRTRKGDVKIQCIEE